MTWTPTRAAAAVALAGGLVLLFAGVVLSRGSSIQLPLVVGALVVLGLTLLGLAIGGGVAALRHARAGHDAAAFWAALGGGVCALLAAGMLAAALVYLLVVSSTS